MLSKSDKKYFFETFATKKDLGDVLVYCTNTFATKDELKQTENRIMSVLQEIIGEIKAIREELTVLAYRQANHSDRLERLEEKVGLV